MTFRKAVFWLHLAAGLVAGLIIAVMSLTGAALAFENEIVAWAERDARRVTPPAADAPRLSLEELQNKFREAQPEVRPSAMAVSADPAAAVAFSAGREGTYYVNPYTGEVRQPASTKARDFMRLMEDWHRWLALTGEHRATGRAITGACNAAFLFLAVSGLWLWWPRKWRTKGLKRSLVFLPAATGKARDWNWHNVIGFWSLPVLVVLTASGVVMSYRWANDLVYKSAGETPPVQGAGPGAAAAPAVEISKPEPGTRPLNPTALLAVAQKEFPHWETITLRVGNAQRGPRGEGPRPAADPTRGEGERRAAPSAASVTVKTPGAWPRTATTALTLDPFTGAVLKREGFGDFSAGRQARTWLRFLHTGQALGWAGQFVAGLASLGGVVLVYTGFALAWRRFFLPKEPKA
jgi:uncharacterized iron-regulated membrane protein